MGGRSAARGESGCTVNRLQPVADLLKSQSTLALSTAAADGSPRLAPLFYLSGEDLRLYWFSSASSEHARNLKRDPAAAIAVYSPTDDWKQILGVQMRGHVAVVTDRTRRKAIAKAYIDRFCLGTIFGAAISRSRLYEFQPVWLRYLDTAGLIASLGNRLLLRSAMPTEKQLGFWDRRLVPVSRTIDPLLRYRLGKSIVGVWRNAR